jgi:hypothetical protein
LGVKATLRRRCGRLSPIRPLAAARCRLRGREGQKYCGAVVSDVLLYLIEIFRRDVLLDVYLELIFGEAADEGQRLLDVERGGVWVRIQVLVLDDVPLLVERPTSYKGVATIQRRRRDYGYGNRSKTA